MATFSDLKIDDARGAHFGDTSNIYNVYAAGKTYDPGDDFNFDDYIAAASDRLRDATKHVCLDLEPLVVAVDRELRSTSAISRITDVLKSDKPVAILGTAGSGKSASLRYLAATNLDGELRIYVELARYRKDPRYSPMDSLLVLIGEMVNNWAGDDAPPSLPLLRRILKEKNRGVVLLLDGLNEIEATIREECLRGIVDVIDAFKCRVVLGTRPHGFTPPEGWNIFRLKEMDERQVELFLEAEADERTRIVILQTLDLADNPLLRLPLFLKYVIKLVQDGGATAAVPRNRTSIVSRYTRELLSRDGEIDRDMNLELLSVLAIELQKVGQSLPRDEAEELLARHFKHDAKWAGEQLVTLTKRGLLALDERYVRFFHHTIQEYFYAEGKRRTFFPEKRPPRLMLMARELRRRSQEDALAFVAADATDEQMKCLLRIAVRANVSLGMRWADDLSTGQRAQAAVDDFLRRVRKRLNAISLYSKLSYSMRRVPTTFVVLGAALGSTIAVSTMRETGMTLGDRWAALTWAVLLALIAIAAGHALITYPGCEPAAEIFGAFRNLRSDGLRKRMEDLAREIMRRPLASFELRQIAASVVDTDFDPLDFAEMPYVRIQLLGFSDDERVPDILQAVVEAGQGNVYSRIALETMRRRAIRNSAEITRVKKIATDVWSNRKLDLAYRRVAALCLRDFDPTFGIQGKTVNTWQAIPVIGLFVLLGLLWSTGAFFLAFGTGYLSLLMLPPVLGILLAAIAWKLGAKRVRGYYGGDGWHPLYYFISTTILGYLTLTAIPVVLFLVHYRRIRLNARGLDVVLVRQLAGRDFTAVN